MGKALGKHPNFDVCLCDDKLATKQNCPQLPHFPSSQSHSSWESCSRDQSFCHPSPLCSCFPCPGWDETAALKAWARDSRRVPVGLPESAWTWFGFPGKSSRAVAHGWCPVWHLSPNWGGFGHTQAFPRPSHLSAACCQWQMETPEFWQPWLAAHSSLSAFSH